MSAADKPTNVNQYITMNFQYVHANTAINFSNLLNNKLYFHSLEVLKIFAHVYGVFMRVNGLNCQNMIPYNKYETVTLLEFSKLLSKLSSVDATLSLIECEVNASFIP